MSDRAVPEPPPTVPQDEVRDIPVTTGHVLLCVDLESVPFDAGTFQQVMQALGFQGTHRFSSCEAVLLSFLLAV